MPFLVNSRCLASKSYMLTDCARYCSIHSCCDWDLKRSNICLIYCIYLILLLIFWGRMCPAHTGFLIVALPCHCVFVAWLFVSWIVTPGSCVTIHSERLSPIFIAKFWHYLFPCKDQVLHLSYMPSVFHLLLVMAWSLSLVWCCQSPTAVLWWWKTISGVHSLRGDISVKIIWEFSFPLPSRIRPLPFSAIFGSAKIDNVRIVIAKNTIDKTTELTKTPCSIFKYSLHFSFFLSISKRTWMPLLHFSCCQVCWVCQVWLIIVLFFSLLCPNCQ